MQTEDAVIDGDEDEDEDGDGDGGRGLDRGEVEFGEGSRACLASLAQRGRLEAKGLQEAATEDRLDGRREDGGGLEAGVDGSGEAGGAGWRWSGGRSWLEVVEMVEMADGDGRRWRV
ncbi:hypothetical protein DRE_00812 [Drechslerella stenobrocha 248]|uniref:Uncharacterized protein n=1 Tax=Drechslerella stenobrocha 248 TaxID=1043628 RepID=W7HZP8_9PEZI|nr:hypothetical protein DRE_00812 [Drechslerella stenobrocha 248]